MLVAGVLNSIFFSLVLANYYSLYPLLNMARVTHSSRLKWADHVARVEKGRSAFKILTDKPTGKRPLGRPRLDGRTILEWILKNGYQYELLESPCECFIEPPGSISHGVS